MRIGIDIDGCLLDCERFMIDYGSKYCIENNLPINMILGTYNDAEMLGLSDEQTLDFWRKYIIEYFSNYKARDFASEVLKKLKEEGNEIYIITNRNEYGIPPEFQGKVREITEEWLNKNNIPYDKLIFAEGSKLPYCIGNYIEVMVEDWDKVIEELSTKIPVICFHNDWNGDVKGNNIVRAHSWYEVYEKIKKLGQ